MPVSFTRRSFRPLGFYPTSNAHELFSERMIFREGVRMLSALVDQNDMSVRSNSVTIRGDGSSSACSVRNNPEIMNDANFAKNFSRIPSRVTSARTHSSNSQTLDESSVCSRNTATQRTGITERPRTTISQMQQTDITDRRMNSTDRQRLEISERPRTTIAKHLIQQTDITEKQRKEITERHRTEMCKLQCEVLGSYLCADCIRIRKEESVAQEKRDMYPQINVDTRCLVAPGKVQYFNSNLPPQFYNERRSLECGCVVHLDQNFWNPVIFTQTDVFDRIRQASRTNQLLTPVKTEQASTTQKKKVGSRQRKKLLPVDLWSYIPVNNTPPRYDMKVTVTFSQKEDKIIA